MDRSKVISHKTITFLTSMLPLYSVLYQCVSVSNLLMSDSFYRVLKPGDQKKLEVLWCLVRGLLYVCFIQDFTKIWSFCFLLQARNSYSNEVVAIKKMSYNGKQTTEVRNTVAHRSTCQTLPSKPQCHCKCL